MAQVARLPMFMPVLVILWMATFVWSLPGSDLAQLQRRTDPFFPPTPESCPICQKDYGSIQGCAEAAPVLQNFTNVIFNPGAFIDTIRCACADTFKAVFPQCVDCFIQTGQDEIIMEHQGDLPAVVEGLRQVCAMASTLLGNVTDSNNDPANSARTATTPIVSRSLLVTPTLLFVVAHILSLL